MNIVSRKYQQKAVDAVWNHLREKDTNPCVVLPTGTGKSVVIAMLVYDACVQWSGRVLILAHVKELLQQNAEKIAALCPDVKIGIYSAGLGGADTSEQCIVAGIQSVYKKADELGKFDLIIVDEAHLINSESENSMYTTLINAMKDRNGLVRVIGMTATPYRMKGGLICKANGILNEVCYEAELRDMIRQGFLCPLTAKGGREKADLSNLHIRGGEFIPAEVDAAMDCVSLVNNACKEIVERTKDRRAVLVFASSVTHCEHVADKLREITGEYVGVVTGDTPAEVRDLLLRRFKGETVQDSLFDSLRPIKYLVNVNVLTTGFDAPCTDCIALLRPTASPGLLTQMIGRGTRLSDGKANCLILDYGDNLLRHGPVDAIRINKETGKGTGDGYTKECPECFELISAGFKACPSCGFVFPSIRREATHGSTAAGGGVMTGEITETDWDITEMKATRHSKRVPDPENPKPDTVRITFFAGLTQSFSMWLCPEHQGYARSKFEAWWTQQAPNCAMPATVDDALFYFENGLVETPVRITVKEVTGNKFPEVVGYLYENGTPRPNRNTPEEVPDWHNPLAGDDDDLPF